MAVRQATVHQYESADAFAEAAPEIGDVVKTD